MIVIQNKNCIFIDCDDTLVMWESKYINEDHTNTIIVSDPISGFSQALVPHDVHIKYLKDAKVKNKNTIVVWSAGGWEWAKSVVNALELNDFVDAVMEKPTMYIDDLHCEKFMGIRKYEIMKKST